jgi:hypothetical protein
MVFAATCGIISGPQRVACNNTAALNTTTLSRSEAMSDRTVSAISAPVKIELRDVVGFPFYKVGSDGSIWSCRTRGGRIVPWQPMKPYTTRRDHLCVGLRVGDKLHRKPVAHAVLEAFVGPRPKGLEACHYNGCPRDNSVSNLRWDTHTANMADRDRHGRTCRGEAKPDAKLTESQVIEIRRRCAAGELQKDIAPEYGVNKSCIQKAASGTTWKHVVMPSGKE